MSGPRHGDRTERARFLRLVTPILDDLYRFACRLEGDRVRAEDLVQQAILVGLRQLGQLDDDGAFKAWQSRILYRTFLNERKRKRPVPTADEQLHNLIPIAANPRDTARVAKNRELGRRLGDALDRLPEAQRRAVWLVDGQGFTYVEAGQILGLPTGTATSRVIRGRAALRTQLRVVAQEQGVIP